MKKLTALALLLLTGLSLSGCVLGCSREFARPDARRDTCGDYGNHL